MEFPVGHIRTGLVSPLIGGEKDKRALEIYDYRICGRPMPAPFREIGDRRVAIVDIDRVAVGLLLREGVAAAKEQKDNKLGQMGFHDGSSGK